MRLVRLPVPNGFVITARAYELWMGSWNLEGSRAKHPPAPADAPIPESVREAIDEALRGWPVDQVWAVRSSATAEDLGNASFAGQYQSILKVRGLPDLLDAVHCCWRSVFGERAVSYRQRQSPGAPVQMAVVVQELVPAEVAGVLFTADPVSQDRTRIVIESVSGLGEALVSGRIAPDRIVLGRTSLQVLDSTEVPDRAGRLDHAQARRLAELGLAVEQLFGTPQDIEWALRGEEVSLLQARPITTLAGEAPSNPDLWTNANIMEALPEVVTPMAWSLLEILRDQFLLPLLSRIGVDTEIRQFCTLIAGRAYLNVRMVNDLVNAGAGIVPIDVATAFGGLHKPIENALKSNRPERAKRRVHLKLWRLCRYGWWLLPGLIRQQQLLERWGRLVFSEAALMPPQTLADEGLAQHPLNLIQQATVGAGPRTWAAAVWMAAAGVGGSTLLFRLTRQWLNDSDGSIGNRLLAGASEMQSAENGLALLRLAAWIREHPKLMEQVLQAQTFNDLDKDLDHDEIGHQFLRRWNEFLRDHGHQARGGMDIAQPRWREMPDFVLDMLRTYLSLQAGTDPLTLHERRLRERHELFLQTRRQLRNPLKRWFLTWIVRIAQRGLAQRENVKNQGVRMVGIMRAAVLEAGRRLVERGFLSEPKNIFFLRLEELGAALERPPGLDISSLVAQRKAEHERLRALSPPPVVVGTFSPTSELTARASLQNPVLHGLAVSPGTAVGRARVILQADADARLAPGEILVAPYTDPGWTPYFLAAAAVVVDVGGMLSHGSVVAREYGLPAVVNVGTATQQIKNGQRIRVDGSQGTVTLLDAES